jgi:hypothetical protein
MAPKSPSASLSSSSGMNDCGTPNGHSLASTPNAGTLIGHNSSVPPLSPGVVSIASTVPPSGLLASSPVSADHAHNSMRQTPKSRRNQTEIEIPETIHRKKDSTSGSSLASRTSSKTNADCFAALVFDEDDEDVPNELRSSDEHLNNGSATANHSHLHSYGNHTGNSHFRSYSHSPTNSNEHTLPSYADPLPETHTHPPSPTKGSCAAGFVRFQSTARNSVNCYVKTGLTLLYAMLAMTSNLFVLAWVHERVPMTTRVLPDLGFDLFPRVDWVLNISEYIIMGEVAALFTTVALHRYRQLLLRRMCLIMGTLYIFRAICMASTVFPVANDKYYCSPQLRDAQNPDQSIPLGM